MATTEKKTYQAYCTTCSWVGRSHTTKTDAVIDGDEHEIAISRAEPDASVHHPTDVRSS